MRMDRGIWALALLVGCSGLRGDDAGEARDAATKDGGEDGPGTDPASVMDGGATDPPGTDAGANTGDAKVEDSGPWELCPQDRRLWCYPDEDGDGFAPAGAVAGTGCGSCSAGRTERAPEGADVDCDDGLAGRYPDSPEQCNGRSDDCDADVDEGAAASCEYDHAAGECLQGACALGQCEKGFADCDGSEATGCEQALNAESHCGGCGIECDAEAACLEGGVRPRCVCDPPLIGDGSDCIGYGPAAVGLQSVCAIHSDRSIECIVNSSGAPITDVPEGSFRQLDGGGAHFCALGTNGAAVCFGSDDSNGELGAPEGETFVQVVAGGSHSCGLRADGRAVCWGISQVNPGLAGECGQSEAPSLERFRQITAGNAHTCGLRDDGSAVCWGAGGAGTCGEFYDHGQSTPPAGESFVQISAGGFHTCGLRADGTMRCWGAGQTDTQQPPDRGQSDAPQDATFTFISAGEWNTCGVTTDQRVRCWGAGTVDAASFDTNDFRQSRPPTSGSFLRVYAGAYLGCAPNTGGSINCWGDFAPESTPGAWPVSP
jgi:hypothetical protein